MLREAGNASVTPPLWSVCHLDGTCLLPPCWPAPEGDTNKSAGDCVFSTMSSNVSHVGVRRKWTHLVCQPASAQMHLTGSRAGRGQCWGGCCGERSWPALVSAHRCSSPQTTSCSQLPGQPQTAQHAASMLPLYKPSFPAPGLVFIHPTHLLEAILPLQVAVEMH